MSFSRKVKEELSRQSVPSRHCQIAELAGIIGMCGRIRISEDNEYKVYIHTENIMVARKYYNLIKELFNTKIEVKVRNNRLYKKSKLYTVVVNDYVYAKKILQAVKLIDIRGEINENLSVTDNIVVQNQCCKRAFIRGVFLAAGSISDPNKAYHFEINASTNDKAKQIQDMIKAFDLDAKIVIRKKNYVVYIKEGSQIVDILNVMEAHLALMNLENVRILKEMRNAVNRKVNCETANINKTVNAASRQIEDILYIKEKVGFEQLNESLKEIAKLRIENPDLSLVELGGLLNKPIGKSGVNHRLRKLSQIATNIREQIKEEM